MFKHALPASQFPRFDNVIRRQRVSRMKTGTSLVTLILVVGTLVALLFLAACGPDPAEPDRGSIVDTETGLIDEGDTVYLRVQADDDSPSQPGFRAQEIRDLRAPAKILRDR